MDFSSCSRALNSLLRRRPEITHERIRETTLCLLENGGGNDVGGHATEDVLRLTTLGASNRWEALAVGLYLATERLETWSSSSPSPNNEDGANIGSLVYPEGPRVPECAKTFDWKKKASSTSLFSDENDLVEFCRRLSVVCVEQLEHSEPRVRTLVARFVGVHARVAASRPERLRDQRQVLRARITRSLFAHLREGRGGKDRIVSKENEVAMDDTTGWKALETSLQALAAYLDDGGRDRAPLGDDDEDDNEELLDALRSCAVDHVNRHVRASALKTIEIAVPRVVDASSERVDARCRDVLETALADNWSQVRMAACTLCRTLLTRVEDPSLYYPALLPRMCLNRFYLAQGVRLYSQETWKLVLGEDGPRAVANHAGAVVRYYVNCCDADNHVVREAACQAVAELAQKVGTHPEYALYLEPFVPTLLQALLMCFHDESWPVRDQACLACGTFTRAYPEITKPELPILFDLWKTNLTDQIWSVREGAAVALGEAVRAHGEDLLVKVLAEAERLLPGAREQPAMTLEEKRALQNDIFSHTDSQLYSCGSLAPKLKKGGCSDCVVNRPRAPWERTDGCVYLIRELCRDGGVLQDDRLSPLVEELADAVQVTHFPEAEDLRATLWRCLPDVAEGLGKKRFKKSYLNLFLDTLIRSLERGNATCEHAAATCAQRLQGIVGRGVFEGRVREVVGDHAVDIVECRVRVRGAEPVTESVSPFGPPPTIAGNRRRGGAPSVSPFGPPPTTMTGEGVNPERGSGGTMRTNGHVWSAENQEF